MNIFLSIKSCYNVNTKLFWSVQFFLITLIITGVVLLFTQKFWLPKVVDYILAKESNDHSLTSGDKIEDFDLKNAVMIIDGKSVSLVDGTSEMLVEPGSADKIVTRYFGNEAIGDLNNDKKSDVVFLVSQETGGSGLFYYAVAALRELNGYVVTNTVLIGDRIIPQTTLLASDSGEVQIKYFDRKSGEPMTTSPTVETDLYLRINENYRLEKFSRELEWGVLQ